MICPRRESAGERVVRGEHLRGESLAVESLAGERFARERASPWR
jgi:hypothetical protein